MVAVASAMMVPVSASMSWTRPSPVEQAVRDMWAGGAAKVAVPASAVSHSSPSGTKCAVYAIVIALSGDSR